MNGSIVAVLLMVAAVLFWYVALSIYLGWRMLVMGVWADEVLAARALELKEEKKLD